MAALKAVLSAFQWADRKVCQMVERKVRHLAGEWVDSMGGQKADQMGNQMVVVKVESSVVQLVT